MRDILLEKIGDNYDISFEDGDFKSTEGLESAIIISLFTDKRASESEVSEPSLRRGWVGNELNEDSTYNIGSKLWLVSQARANQKSLNDSISFAKESLQWMIDDQIAKDITVTGELLIQGVKLFITFTRFDSSSFSMQFNLWENTSIV